MVSIEEKLIKKIKKGDRDAFAELVELYKDRVFQVTLRMVGNTQEAEDIAQETFLRVYSNLEHYDPSYKFSTWIFRIATNLSIDHLRKRKQTYSLDKEMEGTDGLDLHERLADPTKGPEEILLSGELQGQVQSAIETLSPKYKSIMILRYLEDLSLTEISDIVKLPISTIKTRIHRGREALKKRLKR
ncbi:MAG TPA: RNA polymerase sigma factor SigW [Bacillota bacterium]|nr:RNA polymerase sigma factor SigW [Bacillota bacterium]